MPTAGTDLDRGIAACTEVIGEDDNVISPKDPGQGHSVRALAFHLRGWLHYFRDELDQACDDLDKAYESDPEEYTGDIAVSAKWADLRAQIKGAGLNSGTPDGEDWGDPDRP